MNYLTGKLAELTEEIFSVTQRGELRWQNGDGKLGYIAQIGDLSVALEKITGADGMPAVAVLLRNRDGQVVQRYTDAELSDHDPDSDEHRSFWELLTELEEMARWSADGLFELIDDMMANLVPEDGEPDPAKNSGEDDYGWSGKPVAQRLQPGRALDPQRRSIG